MKSKASIRLPLTDPEKANLRKHKTRIAELPGRSMEELCLLLDTTKERAKTLYALAEFQTIPSVGIQFAQDLIFLGYYALHELEGKDAAKLTNEYEKKIGYWIDPCVEDQFRLVVHVANTGDRTKNWWDFTAERKQYRSEHAYPADRPGKAWHETIAYTGKSKNKL